MSKTGADAQDELIAAATRLAFAQALSGVRALADHWEDRACSIGTVLPVTTWGALCELDEAITAAKAAVLRAAKAKETKP